eukprot:scaffold6302_cov157-Skeletonema_menzelii.AAC.2
MRTTLIYQEIQRWKRGAVAEAAAMRRNLMLLLSLVVNLGLPPLVMMIDQGRERGTGCKR